jgi:hypothetical protein
MLEFTLNNIPFLLDESSSIRITWVNPACQFDDFPGDVGMGITIPVNDVNRALLGNPERFERYQSASSIEFEGFVVRYKGVFLLNGTLVITNANSTSYSAWLRSETGILGETHREQYIYDIDAFAVEKTFENKADYDPLTDDYGCPKIYNPEFFRDKGRTTDVTYSETNPDWYLGSSESLEIDVAQEVSVFTEAFRKTSDWFVNDLNEDNTVRTESNTCITTKIEKELDVSVVTPMLFLKYVIETLLKDAGLFIENSCLADDTDLQKLLIYNNWDITQMSYVTSAERWDSTDPALASLAYSLGITYFTRNYSGTFMYSNLLPKVQLKDFIMGISNLLNVAFHFKGDGKVDIIDREKIITGTTINISDYMIDSWILDEKKNVTLKFVFNHDSNDTLFSEYFEEIDDRRDDEKDAVADVGALLSLEDPDFGEIRFVTSLNSYYEYCVVATETADSKSDVFDIETLGWSLLSTGFQNGYYNADQDEEEEIETCFSSLQGIANPKTEQSGNVDFMQFSYESFTPRLLFYLGNNTARSYTDTMAIDWEKETVGLLETRWKKWNRIWSTRQPVERDAQLPLNVLKNMVTNITSKFKSNEGEFIIDEIETEFTMHKIGATTITGYKI